jgi:ADP-heptose:LPS heptosyltransferase
MRRHVLVARMDNDGDVLLAGPAIRAVAASGARVTLLCGPRGRRAAELLPGVDQVIVRAAEWIDPEPEPVSRAAILAFVDELAALALDEALVLTSFHQSPLPLALLLRMAGVPCVAATSTDYPGSLLDVRHRIDDDVHEVERSLSLVATLGHRLAPGDDGRLAVRAARPPAGLPSRFVAVHPGASVPARAWAPEHHAELVALLTAAGRDVVVTGGPGEEPLTAQVAGTDALDLGGRTTLAELAELLAGAEAVVVGNTGPAHLAAAVGTPVVSLFAPTVPAVRWRPWSVPHVLLGEQDIACAGCRARECPLEGHPCLSSVSVAEVVDATEALAGRAARAAEREAQVEAELRSALERQGQVA